MHTQHQKYKIGHRIPYLIMDTLMVFVISFITEYCTMIHLGTNKLLETG